MFIVAEVIGGIIGGIGGSFAGEIIVDVTIDTLDSIQPAENFYSDPNHQLRLR